MPKWREVLTRVMGGDDRLTADDKAAILGVPSPSRRQLFKFGGAAIIGAAVLAACGDDDDDSRRDDDRRRRIGHDGWRGDDHGAVIVDGARVDDGPGDHDGARRRPQPVADGAQDLVLARTAASLEKLAVDAYGAAAALLTTAADQGRGDDVRRPPPDAPRRSQRRDHRRRRQGRHADEPGRLRRPREAGHRRRQDRDRRGEPRASSSRRRRPRRTCSPVARCRPRPCARRS